MLLASGSSQIRVLVRNFVSDRYVARAVDLRLVLRDEPIAVTRLSADMITLAVVLAIMMELCGSLAPERLAGAAVNVGGCGA